MSNYDVAVTINFLVFLWNWFKVWTSDNKSTRILYLILVPINVLAIIFAGRLLR